MLAVSVYKVQLSAFDIFLHLTLNTLVGRKRQPDRADINTKAHNHFKWRTDSGRKESMNRYFQHFYICTARPNAQRPYFSAYSIFDPSVYIHLKLCWHQKKKKSCFWYFLALDKSAYQMQKSKYQILISWWTTLCFTFSLDIQLAYSWNRIALHVSKQS